MAIPNSPLFPASSLTLPPGIYNDSEYLMPQLPEVPLVQTSSIKLYIVPTEKHLFVQGFKPVEYEGLPPTLLRGCLVLRVMKETKIRSISLLFKGNQRTDWPEGIPPKKNVHSETVDIVSHTWPFFQAETAQRNCGADLFIPRGGGQQNDVSHLNLSDLHPVESAASFATSLMKRATTPVDGSLPPMASLAPTDSMADLTAVLSSLSVAENRKPGYFEPGDYIYNFEHPIPVLSPETTSMTFGMVQYHLESTIVRSGTFKANLVARLPVEVVRIPSENSVEENEPIVIERDWEDQLRYEIVVGSKSAVLDSYVPLAFRFIPLYGKVALHRIRVYVLESANYYCHNKTVHREEPVKRFLLLEHKAKKNKSLLSQSGGLTDESDDEILPRELEFQLFIPTILNKKYEYCIHPDTSFDNIKCEHWIKISLRISKQDPANPEKRKHFEILIDSPIHLCSALAAHCNTLLPAYDHEPEFLPKYAPHSPPMSPEVTPIDYSHHARHLILAALFPPGGINGGSSIPPPRSSTPIEFQHISTRDMNNEPIERDNDLHLEANLYKPEELKVLDALASPQAKPYSPVTSPSLLPINLGSPTRSRAPSLAPPAFDDLASNVDDTLPPAYFREDPALSLSPLRIDRPSISTTGNSSSLPTMNVQDTSLTGIKGMLNKQLDSRHRNSLSDRESLKSTPSKRSLESTPSKKSSESASSKKSVDGSEDWKALIGKEKQGTNGKINPSTGTSGAQRNRTDRSSLDKNSSFLLDEENEKLPQPYTGPNDDSDITDIKVHGAPPVPSAAHLRVEKPRASSRRSSISLATLSGDNEDPLDQTLPLLSLSSSSVNEDQRLFDYDRRLSVLGSNSDLVDVTEFGPGDFNVNGSLFTLRNPRIAKHYQNSPEVEFEETNGKARQKSFGVLPFDAFRSMAHMGGLTESSGERKSVSAVASSTRGKGDAFREPPIDVQEVTSQ